MDGIPQTYGNRESAPADPNFYQVLQVLTVSRAYYDAARVSAIVPQWRRWSFEAAYWFK
ncbi:MAG: hypothetical protein U5J83_06340 [Bryobacterales bacterium]|nr:hypothetical protein [Bryobacterales bacterium]